MNIFKMIYSHFFHNFAKMSYKKFEQNNEKEEIYHDHKKGKWLIEVKDADIGNLLYEVIKCLNLTRLNTENEMLRITQYSATRDNCIKWFCIQGIDLYEWKEKSKYDKLREIVEFVHIMQDNGLVIDDTKFNNFECNSISEFLSFFIQSTEEDKIERSKGCMIQFIHYICSDGGNLKEFYESFINMGIYDSSNMPYNSRIARMCYDYFDKGVIPSNILEVIKYEYIGEYDLSYLIAIRDKLDCVFEVTEKTDDYTIYDGNIKIYQNVSSGYEKFLRNIYLFETCKSLEQVQTKIVDLDKKFIGYKFAKRYEENIKVFEPNTQNEIFDYILKMVEYLKKYNFSTQGWNNDFEIEKCLVWVCDSSNNGIFKCNTIKDLYNLTINDTDLIKEQVTEIFFKLLANFIAKKYGELTSKEQFLEKIEIRYLSPIVAKEFIKFALQETVNYQEATEELFKLLDNRAISIDASFSYDERFCYNSLDVPITFDYEVESRYNLNLKKGSTENLPDNQRLVIFKKSCKIEVFLHQEEATHDKIRYFIRDVENIQLIGFSEIIVGTDRLNSDNMYNIVGYIAEKPIGKKLTDEVLLQLNNKDLLKVAANLFCNFKQRNILNYIPLNEIYMDNVSRFYIDYLAEDFQMETRDCRDVEDSTSDVVNEIFDYLVSIGYNQNAFLGWSIPRILYNYRDLQKYLLCDLVNKLDVYCEEHKIYYNSESILCPACKQTKYLVPQNFEEKFVKVFEDSVATHYSIDLEYNLKIYKSTYNTQEVEANVKRLITLVREQPYVNENYFCQDCFLPRQIALDNNKNFIGYVYDAVDFETINGDTTDVCVDLQDKENLANLPRLKSLIRLVTQVNKLTNSDLSFMMNPFSHVFLNTSHKKQVQILNIEFLCPCSNRRDYKNTKRWTSAYIYKVLQSDSTIWPNNKTLPQGLDFISEVLTQLAGELTKYCSIHKMYYKSSYLCCPKCVDPEQQGRNIEYVIKDSYSIVDPINEGGEAFIYSYPLDESMVSKVFKEGEIDKDFKSKVLLRILIKKNILEELNMRNNKYKYVIPKKILIETSDNQLFGYIMDKVENAYPISTLRDKVEIEKLGLSMKDIFEIIITIGEGIETLHKGANIYIGDLNGRNILFDEQKNVYFLDFDGMGIDEISPEFCTDGYIDPLSKKSKNITMKDDWYSFAVQAFYYLTYTHPFNGIYYESKNGRDILLEIPDKMERRISLLGNHGIKVPEIALPWDWMNDELKSAFLNIFEGDNRESIVPYLKKQYHTLFTNRNEKSFNKIYRINSKFIATELDCFDGKVVKVINPYSAICENGNERYITILVNNKQFDIRHENINVSGGIENISDIYLSDDKKLAFIVYNKDEVLVVDLEFDSLIYRESITGATNVVVNERTMYFTGISKEKSVIFSRTFLTNGEVVKETYGFGNQCIKWFNVKFNTKFILIIRAGEERDEVYCNSQKFFEFYNCHNQYNIIYDDFTKSWLIVHNFGKGIVIGMDGQSTEIDIGQYTKYKNIENIRFVKGNIYIPNEGRLDIFNVKSKKVKNMECHKIMHLTSMLFDINSDGFSVIDQNNFYEVRKG